MERSDSGQYMVFSDHSRTGIGSSLNDSSAHPGAYMTMFRGQRIGAVALHRAVNLLGTPRGSSSAPHRVLVVRTGGPLGPLDILPAQIRRELPVQAPCEAVFAYLAQHHPEWLVALVQRGALKDADLTFAAEAVGRCQSSLVVRAVLLPLLRHSSAVVREGAIYGISSHLDLQSKQGLERLAREDPSPGVRTAARDVLEVR